MFIYFFFYSPLDHPLLSLPFRAPGWQAGIHLHNPMTLAVLDLFTPAEHLGSIWLWQDNTKCYFFQTHIFTKSPTWLKMFLSLPARNYVSGGMRGEGRRDSAWLQVCLTVSVSLSFLNLSWDTSSLPSANQYSSTDFRGMRPIWPADELAPQSGKWDRMLHCAFYFKKSHSLCDDDYFGCF